MNHLKPTAKPLTIINWNEAMIYLEDKYGFETDGQDYPVSILYKYLSTMQYIPEGGRGIVHLPFQDLLDFDAIPDHLAGYHSMEIKAHKTLLIKLLALVIEEFPSNNDVKVYWEF